ncbi:hypothetical protein BKA65DRAFT_402824 [Rhexocercosporidium sp. MPI-PUGE-AT-0058]|nr:hypothetical protein BKA65DRAFT_402824 [Rhexocercosporidium sp. MPI-PUGE-AT-0058]
MSFLRKRSGSQCSFTNGDDEISVRRVEQTEVSPKSRSDTIQSARSSCSSVEASDFAVHDSCVLRNFPKHKSSHLRFLAWVAYTRKYTDEYITEDERRTYRMTSVAKKIFSKLGAKPHRSDHITSSSSSETSKSLSKMFEDSDASVPPYFQDPFQQNQSTSWGYPNAQELPNSAVVPEMAGDWTAASHELPDTYISEMIGTECPIELGGGIETWEDNFYAENLEEWDMSALPSPKGRGSSPKLEIDTSIFAFTHIACALAITTHDDEAKIHTQKWFQDSLQWSAGLRGERQQKGYEKVARAIWQPLETLVAQEPTHLSQGLKENCLFATCKHFLDIFESLDFSKAIVPASLQQFNFSQASFERKAKARVIDELIKKPRIEAFIEDVVRVEKRLHQGQIANLRSLELELICAGKLASQSDTAYNRFLQHVATSCDVMYAEEPAKLSRTRYHVRDIGRIKQLLPDEKYDEEAGQNEREQTSHLRDLHDEDENSLLLDLDFESTPKQYTEIDERHDVAVFSCDEMKWKASNLRRHKRIQHASETKIYVCRWRGCKSSFTRSDNLKCHVREKGHYEGAERNADEHGEGRKKKRRVEGFAGLGKGMAAR